MNHSLMKCSMQNKAVDETVKKYTNIELMSMTSKERDRLIESTSRDFRFA